MSERAPAISPGSLQLLSAEASAALLGPGAQAARLGVIGEGSCFFHSLLAATDCGGYNALPAKKKQKAALELRCAFQDSFTRDAAALRAGQEGRYERLHRDFCSLTSDAEEPQIRHVARRLDANILFIDDVRKTIYCGVRGDFERQKTILILWIDSRHFEPIVLVEPPARGARVRVRGVFDPKRPDDVAKLRHLTGLYASHCAATWRGFIGPILAE